jgi:hypothetical protein
MLLLGDNGVGKTTLLQSLAWMQSVPAFSPKGSEPGEGESDTMEPFLNDTENEVLNLALIMALTTACPPVEHVAILSHWYCSHESVSTRLP